MQRSDFAVLVALLMSIVLIAIGIEDGCAKQSLCVPGLELKFAQGQLAARKLFYDIGIGSLLSILFYGLLVRLPEWQKRRRLRKALLSSYLLFKEKSVALFVGMADGSYNSNLVSQLMDQAEFRRYFKLPNTMGEDRWDAVANKLHEYSLRELQVQMEMLRTQIKYTLDHVDIGDDALFRRLVGFSNSLLFHERMADIEYESVKAFLRFYWSVLTGWNFVTGYPEADMVQELIDHI